MASRPCARMVCTVATCGGRTIPWDLGAATPEADLSGAGDDAPTIFQTIPFRHCNRYGEHHQ